MPREDARTYIIDRVHGLLDKINQKYIVNYCEKDNYLGEKFKQCMVFEHDDGMFKVIDWSDRDNPSKMESRSIIENHRCQFVLKCQYNPQWHCPKLRPFFYFEKTKPKEFSNIINDLRNYQKEKNIIYWRGNPHLNRCKILKPLSDLLNKNYAAEQINRIDFYKELAGYEVALSLPGLGNSCHRDFECFALGTVVLAPRFKNTYYIPLIPNFHYLSIDESDPDILSEAIRERYLKASQEEINFIKNNAIEYYDNYIRFESSVNWMEHLLEL